MIGVREVAGSNPVVPTISINERLPTLAAVLALWLLADSQRLSHEDNSDQYETMQIAFDGSPSLWII